MQERVLASLEQQELKRTSPRRSHVIHPQLKKEMQEYQDKKEAIERVRSRGGFIDINEYRNALAKLNHKYQDYLRSPLSREQRLRAMLSSSLY